MKKQEREIKPSRKVFISNYPHFRYWRKKDGDGLLQEDPLNIYIHVPFCVQKCAYCYYKTEILESGAQLERYVSALIKEIELAGKRFSFLSRPINSIYIGGGTPSLLTEPLAGRIVDCLHKNFSIDSPEFTIEAEPRTLTKKKLTGYKALGVNRLSMGVQSFDDRIIKLSGRAHTGDKAVRAVELIHDTGDMVVNIDLLSGLAGETPETWAKTLETAVHTRAHNITVYKMEVYLNTEFFNKSVRKKLIELPTEEQELEFMRTAIDVFGNAGYKPWSFFTFTREGKYHHRYAGNLWRGEDCCAFGPSAFGLLGNYNYQNANEFSHYMEYLEKDTLPVIRGFRLTSKDMMIRDILLGMKLAVFDRKGFMEKHGIDLCSVAGETVKELQEDGYIVVDEDSISLAPRGLLYGDYAGKKLALGLKAYFGFDGLSLY